MSLYEKANTEEEYLKILEEVIFNSHGGLMSCSACGELLINSMHGKHHQIKRHGANWKKERDGYN